VQKKPPVNPEGLTGGFLAGRPHRLCVQVGTVINGSQKEKGRQMAAV